MTGSVLAANAFRLGIVALLRIFREQIHGLLVTADLLLGVGLVEIALMRRIQIVDHALMLVVERRRQRDIDLLGLARCP